MPTAEPGLTIKSLAEVAWLISRVGRQMIESQIEPPSTTLREFWQSTRQLQRTWDQALDDNCEPARFEEIFAQVLTTDLLARVWATVLGSIDQRTGRNDLTRIAANCVNGLLQIRNRCLSRIVGDQESSTNRAADQDRLRRRCDRWTDLLIGNLCGRDEYFPFAINPDRARDFAEDARVSDSSRPVELLVAAGVRLSFLGQLPEVNLDSTAFEEMVQSILGCIPEACFEPNGVMKSQAWSDPFAGASTKPVLMPGINLSNLRRRFT